MKLFFKISLILIVFFKTGNLLSDNNIFNVNNIVIEKKDNISNEQLANQAIKRGFYQLTNRVLLKDDVTKVSDLDFLKIKELVTYYNISKNIEDNTDRVKFSVTFDKDKIHDLFYTRGISYSDITDKEFYILPIRINKDKIFIFSNNYFYENWNEVNENELIEFILPLENIEIIQIINRSKNSLLDLELNNLLEEYSNKNIAFVLIDNSDSDKEKIYLKARIQNKVFSKNLIFKKDLDKIKTNKKIIIRTKAEIVNLVKSQNLIDIRTPSFINVKFNLNKRENLVLLNSRIKKVDQIENIFVQEFNKDYVKIRIKYLGKLEKIIHALKNENIKLQLINDQWFIRTL